MSRCRTVAWFVLSAVSVYATLLAIAVGLAMANGEGVACRGTECGAVSNWLEDARPFPVIVTVSVAAGLWVARRRSRSPS